ncbi:hypothetical protein E0J20_33265, partial [Rhizobium leguminosarum bv. viciae]
MSSRAASQKTLLLETLSHKVFPILTLTTRRSPPCAHNSSSNFPQPATDCVIVRGGSHVKVPLCFSARARYVSLIGPKTAPFFIPRTAGCFASWSPQENFMVDAINPISATAPSEPTKVGTSTSIGSE